MEWEGEGEEGAVLSIRARPSLLSLCAKSAGIVSAGDLVGHPSGCCFRLVAVSLSWGRWNFDILLSDVIQQYEMLLYGQIEGKKISSTELSKS